MFRSGNFFKHTFGKVFSTVIVILCLGPAPLLVAQFSVSDVKVLSDSVNSQMEESNPMLTNDGRTLYFVRTFSEENMGGKLAGQDIWYSRLKEDSTWSTASNLTSLNTIDNNLVVGISENSDTLYLLNSYSGPLREKWGIAYSTKDSDGIWTAPKEYDVVFKNTGDFRGYFVSASGNVILLSSNSENSYGEEDLYIYIKENGQWQDPIHLGPEINTSGFEISPFLTDDEQRIFFASNGHGGFGDSDIFMTERLDDTWQNWSTPVNLGPEINTKGFDAYLSLDPGGLALYSSSGNGSYSDIYSAVITFGEAEPVPDTTVLLDSTAIVLVQDTLSEEALSQPIYYTVQLLALGKREAPEIDFFEKVDISSVSVYMGNDGLNRFSIGEFESFSLALEAMGSYRKIGYFDAFVRKVTRYEDLFKSSGEKVLGLFYESQ
ncbi:outer membrane protein, porin F precursor [Fulvivirga imtechensis AK7]|uniref:Outer membrane protein, porin F n=1 Tax=Fulvivirga imtechensis AK7 TaxID=1237149 RepID=L8JXT3_9BACT|nr:PD40 domain-containing protein [Fulvivirga imtechensis]ELR72037.1 outer membrane protein, porin F precursor [Fulvivirga imtechensis AK7]